MTNILQPLGTNKTGPVSSGENRTPPRECVNTAQRELQTVFGTNSTLQPVSSTRDPIQTALQKP